MDILGPANAPNAVTARPAENRSFGGIDTFFKDCSSPTANDGTKLQAAFMNAVIAELRSLARGNGLTGASSPIVIEDNADDAMLLKAAQHLIQRGQPNYAADTGSANAVVVALSPIPAELKSGLVVRFKKCNATNTVANGMSLALNAFPAKALKRSDGTDPGIGDVVANMPYEAMYDSGLDQFVLVNFSGAANIFNLTKAPFADYSTYSFALTNSPLNDTVNTIVNFSGSVIGPNNDTVLSTGGCKILTAGRYFIVSYGVLGYHTTTTNLLGISVAGIMKNSSINLTGNGAQLATSGIGLKQVNGSISGIIDCAANDVLNMYMYQAGGGPGFGVDVNGSMVITRVH